MEAVRQPIDIAGFSHWLALVRGVEPPPPGTIYRIYITAMPVFRHMPQVGGVQCISLLLAWFDSGNRDRGRVRIIIEPVHKVRAMAQHGIVIEIALGGDFMGFD